MEGALREAELQDRGEARGEAELLLLTGKHVPLASDQLHPWVERRAKVGGKGRERNERSYKKIQKQAWTRPALASDPGAVCSPSPPGAHLPAEALFLGGRAVLT